MKRLLSLVKSCLNHVYMSPNIWIRMKTKPSITSIHVNALFLPIPVGSSMTCMFFCDFNMYFIIFPWYTQTLFMENNKIDSFSNPAMLSNSLLLIFTAMYFSSSRKHGLVKVYKLQIPVRLGNA